MGSAVPFSFASIMALPTQCSLDRKRLSRRLGPHVSVRALRARIPGTEIDAPLLSVCTREDLADPDASKTDIFVLSGSGYAIAERIAWDLACTGKATIFAEEAAVVAVFVAPTHVFQIAEARIHAD